jgi:hypothetical protein
MVEPAPHVFPPALVPLLRDHVAHKGECLAHVPDDVLVQLLTTVFWAGLETYEGEHRPVGVVFLGTSMADFVTPEGAESEETPLYQWKILRFTVPRPFDTGELVKLSVASTERRIFTAVNLLRDGTLAIAGLAREGFSVDPDPFVKIIAARPGSLSIRSGTELMLGYERGATLTGGEDVVFGAGVVRRQLDVLARAAGLDEPLVPDYAKAVRSLVREMESHGRGGILIVSSEHRPDVAKGTAYHMVLDSSLAALLQLARHLGRRKSGHARQAAADEAAFRNVLRSTFLTEVERVIEELGALTAIDGAVLLNRELALVAFGVMLPSRRPTGLARATDKEGADARIIDLGSRGTRHRAGAVYATDHPGDVVFVASEDGELSCMFREPSHERTLIWRLSPTERAPDRN